MAATHGKRSKRQVTRSAKREIARGRAPSTAAGEFVPGEIHHVRRGKHGAIAIGLSKARRAGIPVRKKK